MKKILKKKKRAQIWVETVIYTLIAFVMIGLVLSFVKPKVEESRDKAIISKTLQIAQEIDNVILSVRDVSGNKRVVDIEIKKGEMSIDGKDDKIVFKIESRYQYSQPGEDVYYGNIITRTDKKGKTNIVTLTSDYSGKYDLTYKGEDESKTITKASVPYKIFITNAGKVADKTNINFEVV